MNSENMYNLGSLALSIHGRDGALTVSDIEEDDLVKTNIILLMSE